MVELPAPDMSATIGSSNCMRVHTTPVAVSAFRAIELAPGSFGIVFTRLQTSCFCVGDVPVAPEPHLSGVQIITIRMKTHSDQFNRTSVALRIYEQNKSNTVMSRIRAKARFNL